MRDGFTDYVAGRSTSLRATAYLLCGDWHTAEDLTQTAFLKLYKVWDRVRGYEALDAYARRTLLRVYLDTRRRGRELPAETVPERPVDAEPVAERLAMLAALATVPPRQRAVLVLRYWEDLSVEQTAELLGCSEGTVKSQASRGLEKLRDALRTTRRL